MSNKNIIKIPCTRSFQNGKEIYNLFFRPEILNYVVVIDQISSEDLSSIDSYSNPQITKKDDGYQRDRDEKDVRGVAGHVMKPDSLLPNGIWLNDRDKISFFEQKGKEHEGISFGYFCFYRKEAKLYCPDGQAREKGVVLAWLEMNDGEDKDGSLDYFALPIVITKVSKEEEATGFLQINDNAKKVETIHKAKIRYQSILSNKLGDLGKKERFQAIGYGVMERINCSGGSLDDMILFDKKLRYKKRQIKTDSTKKNKRKIKAGSFLNSLTNTGVISFMITDFYNGLDTEVQIININKNLNTFWNVIYKHTKVMWEDATVMHY